MLFELAKKIIKKLTDWEHWNFYLFYLPISYAWLGNYIKSGSFWYFTSSNPTLAFGGFEGEGKSEMYPLLPPHLCPKSVFIHPSTPFSNVLQKVNHSGLTYPFIVKPDVGMKGILFRTIENEQQLALYHRTMPAAYIIQEFIDMPLEVSVFYIRKPDAKKGCITALIQKDFLEITGDGHSTFKALVMQHDEAKKWMKKIVKHHRDKLPTVLAAGERFCIFNIGNLYNGATFKSLHHHIDNQLLQVFDEISHQSQFYYGRYDIKCNSVEDLKKGKDFYILEFNGAGSAPNHIHTGIYTLRQAYKEIIKHWKALYEISKHNHQNGYPHWNFFKGYRFLQQSKKHFRILKQLDKELLLH